MEPICPIWAVDCIVHPLNANTNTHLVQDSFLAGGDYEIFPIASGTVIKDLDDSARARLTSFLVEQRMLGVEVPRITWAEVLRAKESKPLPVHERAERLLRFFAVQSPNIGKDLEIFHLGLMRGVVSDELRVTQSAMAWSESTTDEELDLLTDYLKGQGWIEKGKQLGGMRQTVYGVYLCRVEVPGYSHIEEITTNPDSSQCFVAMWFDNSMDDVYEKGFRAAIAAAGYTPLHIDRKPDLIGKIDDEIIAEIRRSRFVVADFTHGDGGARGGVYYEAGFAHGLDLPVIFTCRKEMIDETHFDTRQFNHILWENPEDLRKQLTDRILAAIGQGPNRNG